MSTFYDIPFDKPIKGEHQKVEKTSFFLTQSHSRITQNGKFIGLKKIQVTGKSIIEHNTTLRGDLAKIKIGYYVVVGEGSILKPAEKFGDQLTFLDMNIGDYTVIGRHCVIRAVQIGSCCWIGEGSVINNRCMLEDCGMVLDNTVLAPGTVVPPYTVFGGNPGRCVGRLPPTFDMIMNEHTHAFYAAFKAELTGTLPGSRTQRNARSHANRSRPGSGRHGMQKSSNNNNNGRSSGNPNIRRSIDKQANDSKNIRTQHAHRSQKPQVSQSQQEKRERSQSSHSNSSQK